MERDSNEGGDERSASRPFYYAVAQPLTMGWLAIGCSS